MSDQSKTTEDWRKEWASRNKSIGEAIGNLRMSDPQTTKPSPTDDNLEALIKPLWLAEKPSREAQGIRAELSTAVDDGRYPQWALDYVPDYVWSLIDIAAQRGINAGRKTDV